MTFKLEKDKKYWTRDGRIAECVGVYPNCNEPRVEATYNARLRMPPVNGQNLPFSVTVHGDGTRAGCGHIYPHNNKPYDAVRLYTNEFEQEQLDLF